MQAVILCGGLGTRLREETEFRPKPMVEVGGKPILWHIMKMYSSFGIRDFVICVGYRGRVIKDYFLEYHAINSDFTIPLGRPDEIRFHGGHLENDWTVTVVDTGQLTNTGGRVKRIERFIEGDRFVVSYGDGLADLDVRALTDFHAGHGRLATVTTVKPPMRFGIAEIDAAGTVRHFHEKPRSEDHVSAGFFVFERGVFDYLDDDCVLELEPLQRLAKEQELMSYAHPGFWQPMDTYRELHVLNELWDAGSAPWAVWDA